MTQIVVMTSFWEETFYRRQELTSTIQSVILSVSQIPLRNAHEFHKEDKSFLVDMLYSQDDKEWFGDNFMELIATTILDATYNKVDLDEVISNQKHLTKKQQRELKKVLIKFKKIIQRNTWCVCT